MYFSHNRSIVTPSPFFPAILRSRRRVAGATRQQSVCRGPPGPGGRCAGRLMEAFRMISCPPRVVRRIEPDYAEGIGPVVCDCEGINFSPMRVFFAGRTANGDPTIAGFATEVSVFQADGFVAHGSISSPVERRGRAVQASCLQ